MSEVVGDTMNETNHGEFERAVSGDKDALGRILMTDYRRLSRRVASRLKYNPFVDFGVEDVLQEVFADVFRGIDSFDAKVGSWEAWLNRIVDNRLASMFRDRSRKKRGGDYRRAENNAHDKFAESALQLVAVLADGSGATPSQVVARDEIVRDLQVAIAALPNGQREAIQLYFIEQRGLNSVADILNKTDTAIRGILYRAKKSLRNYLGRSTTWFSP